MNPTDLMYLIIQWGGVVCVALLVAIVVTFLFRILLNIVNDVDRKGRS